MDVVDGSKLKEVANTMMSAIVAFGVKHKTRSELRSIVIERLRRLEREGYSSAARQFVGDHVMSLYGYGGGL